MEIKIHRSVKIISIIISIITISLLYLRFIGTSGLIVREYRIKNSMIGPYNGLKIIHFSDIHYKTTFNEKNLNELVEKINYINPDIVVFTGDIINSKIKYTKNDVNVLNRALKKIKASMRKYIVKGENDIDIFDEIIEGTDFILLNNDYDLIYFNSTKPIFIAGINDNKNLDKINEYMNKNEYGYSILLTHKPDYFINSFDLVLAGHSLNGQIRLPFIGGIIKTNGALKYYDEHYKIGKTDLYVSGGLGSKNINLRFLNKPSINFYRIVIK